MSVAIARRRTTRKVTPQASDAVPSGSINQGEIYTLKEIKARLGLGKYALNQARERGLIVRRIGKRVFVTGEDVANFLRNSRPVVAE